MPDTTIRKRLGRVKFLLLDHWPYQAQVRRAARARPLWAQRLDALPPLPLVTAPTTEVHLLSGHRHADMGRWATWSLLQHLPAARLHVHSDGSLTPADQTSWARLIPGVAFTTTTERHQLAAERLAAYPRLRAWREQHVYSAKFLDFHLTGETPRLVVLDSDVLCFRRPRELLAALAAPHATMSWNADNADCYPVSAAAGVTVPPRVNTGFLVCRRWLAADLAWFEATLARLEIADINLHHHWAEQALYALGATRHHEATAFPAGYDVHEGPTRADAVIRHYVGVAKIRPRFFLEGLPRLLSAAPAASAAHPRRSHVLPSL